MVDTRFHSCSDPYDLSTLLTKAGFADLIPSTNDANHLIVGASEVINAKSNEVALIAEKKYLVSLSNSNAGVIITGEGLSEKIESNSIIIETRNPQLVFTKILNILYPNYARENISFSKQVIKSNQIIEDNVYIGENAVVGDNVEIGLGTIISPNAVIGFGVTIGRNCLIGANASVEYAHLGDNVVINAGARIGTEGFGWLDIGNENIKVPQLGRVIIQDNVEIGANTTIDRGALGDTTIGQNTKIDNLVQVGHNCQIGKSCLIAAMSGISGSTIIEDGVLLGGGAGTSGHLTIGAGSMIHGRAAVTKDWPANSKLAGAPAQDIKDFWREIAAMRRLMRGSKK